MNCLLELNRQGLSLQAMTTQTGFDRKTIRECLKEPEGRPECEPHPAAVSKLDPFKPVLGERLKACVWNAAVLLRELRQAGYTGGYTILVIEESQKPINALAPGSHRRESWLTRRGNGPAQRFPFQLHPLPAVQSLPMIVGPILNHQSKLRASRLAGTRDCNSARGVS